MVACKHDNVISSHLSAGFRKLQEIFLYAEWGQVNLPVIGDG